MSGRPRHTEADQAILRGNLFDAAAGLLTDQSWSDITMESIAVRAQVSRQTLYNQFGSRDEFAQSFVLREAERFLSAVEGAMRGHADDPHTAVEAAFAQFLADASENVITRSIVVRDPGADDLFALMTTRGWPVVELCTERIARVTLELWPSENAARVRFAAETMTRLAISHAGLPAGPIVEESRSLADLIGPFLVSTLQLDKAGASLLRPSSSTDRSTQAV